MEVAHVQDRIDGSKVGMQRIRVGLTGLAVVLLIVLLSTVLLSYVNGKSGVRAQQASEKEKSDDEPLSDLGIVPRAPDNSAAANSAAPVSPPAISNGVAR